VAKAAGLLSLVMKDWHKIKPELFKKQPYYRPGCDILGISLIVIPIFMGCFKLIQDLRQECRALRWPYA